MQVVRMNEVPKTNAASRLFTSDDVTRQPLASGSKNYSASIINFGKGVRNKFHIHDCDQLLIVTAGKGVVVTEQERRVVEPGDVILAPAGEKHWHGATGDSEFSHISIIVPGAGLTQTED